MRHFFELWGVGAPLKDSALGSSDGKRYVEAEFSNFRNTNRLRENLQARVLCFSESK